jgi:puromycin-sensitive aminopeptidase
VDPYRLPRNVVPSRYDLRLEPDLVTHTFTGEETVAVDVTEATADVFLNTAELAITEVSAENAAGERIAGVATSDEEAERTRLGFPRPLSVGPWRLHLRFQGTLNDKLRGFYRSTYKDPSGATHTIAATQFEATDARRAFPCWDEPDFKAVFASTLHIDRALTAVSNTSIVEERLEGARKVVRFADTIRMST